MLQRVLLATDLSARSDRAMDRASMLMRQHGADLVVVHVLEPTDDVHAALRVRYSPRPATARLVEYAQRELSNELRGLGPRVTILVEDGDPADVLLRVAGEQRSNLIVTGVARNEMFGRFTLGKTVDRLLRGSAVPMLVVTDRAREVYRNVVVACDFSDVSRHALEVAAALFPDRELTIFHAYAAPGGLHANATERNREVWRQAASERCAEFLRSVNLSDETRSNVRVLVECGDPALLLRELRLNDTMDLLVLGRARRGALLRALLGSVAQKILAMLPCDALVVPGASVEEARPE